MLELVKSVLRFGRRLFSGKAQDTLEILNETVSYTQGGNSAACHVRELKHVSLDQSFLGLFGSSLSVSLKDGRRVCIRGLPDSEAASLAARLDAAILRVVVATAKQDLENSGSRIQDAWQQLTRDRYCSYREMQRWQEEFADLRFLCVLNEAIVRAATSDPVALECRGVLLDSVVWRETRNDQWVARELDRARPIFESISPIPLTRSQREAILRHDNRVLAVAGAGTGKTTTVVGKVAHLLATGACLPEEILLLSFSRGAVDELKERIVDACGDKVQVRTFHSLGLEIVTKATKRKPAIFEQSDRELLGRTLDYLQELLKDLRTSTPLLDFLTYQFFPTKLPEEFKTAKEYLDDVARHDIRTLKDEKVKSNQEAQVANWLYRNGVEYIYEAEYKEVRTGSERRRVYKPDFYLPEHGIYVEHFGIDRAGNTAPWIAREKYHEDMAWKRELHYDNQTILIETFSYQAREGTLGSNLARSLQGHGVALRPLTAGQLAERKEIRERLGPTAKLLGTALSLFKGDRLTLAEVQSRIGTSSSRSREKLFAGIFGEVVRLYEQGLSERGEIDFGDMITEAARHAESGKYISPFTVVIVDEFQDISRGRAWLLNALLEQHEDARLLCVGDDWQSIYRFSGSDVRLMTDYRRQWPDAVRLDLDKSFRFNDKLQQATEKFVTQNPNQLKKTITCQKSHEGPVVHVTAVAISEIVKKIESRDANAEILVLGRYGHTAGTTEGKSPPGDRKRRRAMTVHKAKGREADYVIVNGVDAGKYGFPSEMADDPLIGLFLAEADSFPNAEERRLFYVALTRARREVWLRVDPQKPSRFVLELLEDQRYSGLVDWDDDVVLQSQKCPVCEGRTVIRTVKATGTCFLSCVYYPRCKGTLPGCPQCKKTIPERREKAFGCPSGSCGWRAPICKTCGHGFEVTRQGKFGDFVACSLFGQTGCRGGEGASPAKGGQAPRGRYEHSP